MSAPDCQAVRLNLGCGTNILPGWINVDSQAGPGVDVILDLDHNWSQTMYFGHEAVDEMLMSHVLEHLQYPLRAMNNLWRAAKAGCKLTIRVPHGGSDDAWEDPTHVRPYFLQSFGYFSQPYHWRSQGYGYEADWQPETVTLIVDKKYASEGKAAFFERAKHERNLVKEMVAVLRKVNPIRARRRELIQLPAFDIMVG